MSLNTALFTGLTGMDANSKNLEVIGNNIVNTNTNGFKANRGIFETQLSQNLSFGSGPDAVSGGTNPTQIGLGTRFAATLRNMNNGPIATTGIGTDLAIEGQGFFTLRQGVANTYTRAGNFDLNSERDLVAIDGGVVQGYGVDSNFNVVQVLQDINIPVGTLTIAESTRNVNFAGNLNASGTVAQNGTQITSQALVDGAAVAATGATLLSDLRAASAPATPLFIVGDTVTIQGAEKGGKAVGTFTFQVGAANTTGADDFGTTMTDLLDFFNSVVGIHEAVANNSTTSNAPGVFIAGAAQVAADPSLSLGQIVFEGNQGTVNEISLETGDVTRSGAGVMQPFIFSANRAADGESVRTTFAVFDSLGTPLTIDLNVVLESRTSTGTTWRFYAESFDDTDLDRVLEIGPGVGGNGLINFDNFGQFLTISNPNIQVDRTNIGALDPLVFQMGFLSNGESVTAFSDVTSTLAAVFQDGSPIGTLESFSVGENGVINGAFTNGLTRTIGQVALSTFANPEGLREIGANQFSASPNSGLAVNVAPGTFGTGRILAGSVELSNVDLSAEFVNLITTSTGFSAASRVITTADQLIQQLLLLGR
jgi:flagellar hook protein FlgE